MKLKVGVGSPLSTSLHHSNFIHFKTCLNAYAISVHFRYPCRWIPAVGFHCSKEFPILHHVSFAIVATTVVHMDPSPITIFLQNTFIIRWWSLVNQCNALIKAVSLIPFLNQAILWVKYEHECLVSSWCKPIKLQILSTFMYYCHWNSNHFCLKT